jgi:hypothetical protein
VNEFFLLASSGFFFSDTLIGFVVVAEPAIVLESFLLFVRQLLVD